MNRSLRAAASALGFLSFASAAQASAIPPDEICIDSENGRLVDPWSLAQYVLRNVDQRALDIDGDHNISEHESYAALIYPEFCVPGRVIENGKTRAKGCSSEAAGELTSARSQLVGFAQNPSAGVTITPTPGASTTDEELQPGLAANQNWKLLAPAGRFVTMRCLPKKNGGEDDGRHHGDPPKFLLAKDIDSLSLPRGNEKELRKVPGAEISFVDDQIGNTETLRIQATAGLSWAVADNLRLIPFAQFIRSHVKDSTGAEAATETTELAFGILSSWFVTDYDKVEFSALYANDLEDGNEVVSARFGWRPGFLYGVPSFRIPRFVFCRAVTEGEPCAFRILTDAKVIATAGHVIDAGANPLLTANRDYARIGGEVGVSIVGLKGIVSDFSLDVRYRHLFSLWNDPKNLSSFTAGVNYWIAKSHVALRLGYERSRDEETLKRTKQWTASLGVRF